MFRLNQKYVQQYKIQNTNSWRYLGVSCLLYRGASRGEFVTFSSIYMNDLEDYFRTHKASGITCKNDDGNLVVFLKLFIIFILLYFDDTVIFSKNKEDLQHTLIIFEKYCEDWKLTVNISKTKVLIFSSWQYSKTYNFYFINTQLELVNEYKYLGIYLSKIEFYLNCKKKTFIWTS